MVLGVWKFPIGGEWGGYVAARSVSWFDRLTMTHNSSGIFVIMGNLVLVKVFVGKGFRRLEIPHWWWMGKYG